MQNVFDNIELYLNKVTFEVRVKLKLFWSKSKIKDPFEVKSTWINNSNC